MPPVQGSCLFKLRVAYPVHLLIPTVGLTDDAIQDAALVRGEVRFHKSVVNLVGYLGVPVFQLRVSHFVSPTLFFRLRSGLTKPRYSPAT